MKSDHKQKFYSNWNKDNWVHFYWWIIFVIIVSGAIGLGGYGIYNDSRNDRVRANLQSEAFQTCMAFDAKSERDQCVQDYRTFDSPGDVKIDVNYE